MDRRELGHSGVFVSAVGFGCGPSARLMVSDDIELQVATVRTAVEGGIDFFDTAAAYGEDGKSEICLGRALQLAGVRPLVSTKVLINTDQLGDIRSATLRSVETSLKRLRIERLDGLMLHNRVAWRSDPDRIVGIGPVLSVDDIIGRGGYAEAIGELRAAGMVRSAGFTAFGGQADAIDELLASGVFDSINADFSAVNPSAGASVSVAGLPDYRSVIDRATSHGMSTMAIRVLGNGRLVSPARRTVADERVASWLEHKAGGVVSGAIRFALAKPGVSTAIMGFSNPGHVRDALAAAAAGPLPAELVRQLRQLHAADAGWLAKLEPGPLAASQR